jgi:uncharacterized Zn-binding protein involved in type VI secretion
MAEASRKTDSITGIWSGEHNGHQDHVYWYTDEDIVGYDEFGNPIYDYDDVYHWVDRHTGAGAIDGEISGGSTNVYINGLPACRVGDPTKELDTCDEGVWKTGSIAGGSSKVKINDKGASRKGDSVNTHTGSGSISAGSSNVFIG